MTPRPRILPRRPVSRCAPGQVSWLSDRPTPRAFPGRRPVAFAGFVPDYRDGVAAAFNRLPWARRGSRGASYAVTVADPCAPRNGTHGARCALIAMTATRAKVGRPFSPREGRVMDMERRDFLKLAAGALTYGIATEPTWAQTAKIEVHWLGQATTKLTTLTGKVIVIDPFLTGNPKTPQQYKNLDTLGKVDVILVTHGHGDHVGLIGRTDGSCDAAELARRTGAPVLGPAGLIATMGDLGWVAPDKAVRFGKGGRVNPLGPQITITQVRAEHSSEITVVDPATKKSTTYPGGEPCGFIVEFENGFKLYHMGDTGLFGDLRLIGEYYKPDLAMIPIGGHFVMDPRDAAYATKEMLRPKFAIPVHYATFPVLRGTPQEYQAALGQTTTQVFPISPGDKQTF